MKIELIDEAGIDFGQLGLKRVREQIGGHVLRGELRLVVRLLRGHILWARVLKQEFRIAAGDIRRAVVIVIIIDIDDFFGFEPAVVVVRLLLCSVSGRFVVVFVGFPVIGQRSIVLVGFLAQLTNIRSLFFVYSGVAHQIALLGECELATAAGERPYARVAFPVLGKPRLHGEFTRTVGTTVEQRPVASIS